MNHFEIFMSGAATATLIFLLRKQIWSFLKPKLTWSWTWAKSKIGSKKD